MLKQIQLTESDVARFWSHVDKSGAHGSWNGTPCWVWIGTTNNKGYGRFSVKHIYYRAHRISYQIANGDVPDGKEICHGCDNPPCVNPAHLFPGTHRENIMDAVRKGRNGMTTHPESVKRGTESWSSTHLDRVARGIRIASAKLTAAQVLEMRAIPNPDRKELAKRYGISPGMVWQILKRKWWRHI